MTKNIIKNVLGQFTLEQDSTLKFSNASGDFNPLHIDPVRARRYQFGSTVIHGVCGTFKAIDCLLELIDREISIESIEALYNKPIRHGDVVEVVGYVPESGQGNVKLELYCNGKRSQIIKLNIIHASFSQPEVKENKVGDESQGFSCPDMQFEESLEMSADVPLYWDGQLMAELFPNVSEYLPNYQACILLGLTNIVGMKCPGLNSVFGGFKVSFVQNVAEFLPSLHFSISHSDHRFSRIIMTIEHSMAQGEIEALFRAKPIQQPTFKDIKSLVSPDQFSNQTALIVGGSRGIGEITTKLIAAGGGKTILSYARGKDDAQRVVSDIRSNGGCCEAMHFDVLDAESDILKKVGNQKISHIYYFASPLIERSDAVLWNDNLYRKFCDFYLAGLTTLLEKFLVDPDYRKIGIDIFIPSTIFLEDPPDGFGEYVAAKAAVEAFAMQFGKKYQAWRIATPRLPRVLTDQTASVEKDSPMKTAEIVLKNLNKLYC